MRNKAHNKVVSERERNRLLHINRIITEILVVLELAITVWVVASIIDTDLSNLPTDNRNPHEWNLIEIVQR